MARNISSNISGDTSSGVSASKTTGLGGDAVKGYTGDRVKGKPGTVSTLITARVGMASASFAQATVTVVPKPVVDFIGAPLSGTGPMAVTFTNQSTGATSYLWTLAGGTPSSSTSTNPSITYGSVGSWDVTLQATGTGGSSSLTKPAYVTVTSVGSFTWQQPSVEGGTINTGRTSQLSLAVNVPTNISYYASPDLLPGQSLQLSGTTLYLVGDSTVPTVNDSDSGTANLLNRISDRDVVIEVMDSPYATIQNSRTGTTYPTQAGLWNRLLGVFGSTQGEVLDGDTLFISPGAIHQTEADMNNYPSGSLGGAMLALYRRINLRNFPGRGRWTIFNGELANQPRNAGGIGIYAPEDIGGQGDFTIEGFQFDNWGQTGSACGIRVYHNYRTANNSFQDWHTSLTLRNFKIGKPPYIHSSSGINGSVHTWLVEDGHIYDTGDGIGTNRGQDHNAYITGYQMTFRGMRMTRTRGSNADGTSFMDGHLLKIDANWAYIDGCCFDTINRGDNTDGIQMKGGGNLRVRGCLFTSTPYMSSGNGFIVYEQEYNADGTVPNFVTWMYGASGHSVVVEKNVFINHYQYVPGAYLRANVMFRPVGSTGSTKDVVLTDPDCITIRDNISLSTTATADLILNPPASPYYTGGIWTNNNSVMTYGADEPGFSADDKALKLYRRTAGTIPASAGTVSTYRFLWPHGYTTRSDAHRGLG